MELIYSIIIVSMAAFVLVYPIWVTVVNGIVLFGRKESGKLYEARRRNTLMSMLIGLPLSAAALSEAGPYHWSKPAVLGDPSAYTALHQAITEEYALSVLIFAAAALLCLFILDRDKLLPPLAAAICVSGIYAGFILSFVYVTQLMKNCAASRFMIFISVYLLIYPINYVMCSLRVLRENVIKYTNYFNSKEIVPKHDFVRKTEELLSHAAGWIWFPLVGIIPLTGLLICICIVCGQGAFGVINAFIKTSDWTYSTMISPPPVEYEGHYLCTVAVNGHERLVKPTRLGIRHGVIIGVNRQLCIANAFEQIIEEKAPRFHRAVRYVYDHCGYPISKHITTKLRADMIYIVMKPLEWLFLTVLYLFDRDPESRIALQYTGKRQGDFDEQSV